MNQEDYWIEQQHKINQKFRKHIRMKDINTRFSQVRAQLLREEREEREEKQREILECKGKSTELFLQGKDCNRYKIQTICSYFYQNKTLPQSSLKQLTNLTNQQTLTHQLLSHPHLLLHIFQINFLSPTTTNTKSQQYSLKLITSFLVYGQYSLQNILPLQILLKKLFILLAANLSNHKTKHYCFAILRLIFDIQSKQNLLSLFQSYNSDVSIVLREIFMQNCDCCVENGLKIVYAVINKVQFCEMQGMVMIKIAVLDRLGRQSPKDKIGLLKLGIACLHRLILCTSRGEGKLVEVIDKLVGLCQESNVDEGLAKGLLRIAGGVGVRIGQKGWIPILRLLVLILQSPFQSQTKSQCLTILYTLLTTTTISSCLSFIAPTLVNTILCLIQYSQTVSIVLQGCFYCGAVIWAKCSMELNVSERMRNGIKGLISGGKVGQEVIDKLGKWEALWKGNENKKQ